MQSLIHMCVFTFRVLYALHRHTCPADVMYVHVQGQCSVLRRRVRLKETLEDGQLYRFGRYSLPGSPCACLYLLAIAVHCWSAKAQQRQGRLQGHRLEARILRYAPLLPRFLMTAPGRHRLSPVLLDFRYFTDARTVEGRIESSRHLQGLDEEMREVRLLCVCHASQCLCTYSVQVVFLQGYGTFLGKLWHLYQLIVQLQQQLALVLRDPSQVCNHSSRLTPACTLMMSKCHIVKQTNFGSTQ